MRKFRAVILLVPALMLGLCACGGAATSTVIVAGSTSVQPYAEVLAEEFSLLNPENAVDVQGGGSAAGITAALSGTADIGMSSRELKDTEKDLWSVEIAKDGLAVIVNPNNPIGDLTSNQIRDIYAATITDWGQLGGAAAKIHLITREEGSGTRSAFEELLMAKQPITPRAIVQDSNGAVRQLVSGDPNSIGFISLGLVDATVKAVRLDGVAPTIENVANGSYGLHRPFLFVANGEPTGQAKQFIDFTLSAQGQQILRKEGLIPRTEGTMR
jgi:phosphate transport system substrate-binding protein